MRVASRRLRSAVRDFRPYLRKRGFTFIQKEIRSLADALGEIRDQDVAIMALEKIATYAPTEVLPALKEYISTRKEVRERARKELTSVLGKSELEELESSFRDSVDKATITNESEITFREISRAIILDRLKEHDCDLWIENFGKQITDARKNKQNEQLAAFVWLLGHFVKLRTKHLRQAFDGWCQWQVHDVSAKLRAALHDGGRAGLTATAASTNVGSELE